jgi:hypothetical protein
MGKANRRIILPAGAVGVLALLIAWVLTHLGSGTGSGTPGSQNSQPPDQHVQTQPGGAIQVVISGDRYLVEGNDVSIEQAVAMARGAASIRIVSGPDSRMGAKMDLEKAMDSAHLSYTVETSPVPGQ